METPGGSGAEAEGTEPEGTESARTEGRARRARVDIGFTGGQVLALRMSSAEHSALRAALEAEGSSGWHDLTAEDAQVAIDLRQVVYVRLESEAQRVGF